MIPGGMPPAADGHDAPAGDAALLSGVLDASLAGIMVFDAVRDGDGALVDLRWVALNRPAEEVLGRTAGQLRGRCVRAGAPCAPAIDLFDRFAQVVDTNTPAAFEYHDAHGGTDRWYQLRLQPHGDGLIAGVADVTEQRRTQHRLRETERVLDQCFSLDIGLLCLADVHGRFLRVSPGWSRTLGVSADELTARPVVDSVHPADRKRTVAALAHLAAGGRPITFDTRCRCSDGSYRTLAWSAAGDTDLGVVFAIAHDVTADRSLEHELRVARDAATAALAHKAQFVANMSHEFRTPLNGVLGLAELLSASALDTRQRAWVGLLQDAGRQLLTILTDVLEFSQLERDQVPAGDTRTVDLRALVDDVATACVPAAVSKGISLTCDVAGPPVTVRADAVRLRQALANVVGNAVKFTRSGGVTISLDALGPAAGDDGVVAEDGFGADDTAAARDAGQDGALRAHIVVRDTGIGIAPWDHERIFAPFVQVDASDTREFGGTGLGLSVARELVERNGGTITVDSEVGAGSTFTVSLPADVAGATEPGAVLSGAGG